jgi:hypothetical protein
MLPGFSCPRLGCRFLSRHFFTGHRDVPDPFEPYLPAKDQLEFEDPLQITINTAKVRVSDFALPAHQCVYEFWLANKKAKELPLSTAIDPRAFWPAVGFIHLIEPNEDNTDFKYRLFGSRVSEVLGLDMTGKWFSESPVSSWTFYRRQLAATVALRTPLYSENNAAVEISTVIRWCRLLLPMVDDQGRVDRVLAVNAPINRRDAE